MSVSLEQNFDRNFLCAINFALENLPTLHQAAHLVGPVSF